MSYCIRLPSMLSLCIILLWIFLSVSISLYLPHCIILLWIYCNSTVFIFPLILYSSESLLLYPPPLKLFLSAQAFPHFENLPYATSVLFCSKPALTICPGPLYNCIYPDLPSPSYALSLSAPAALAALELVLLPHEKAMRRESTLLSRDLKCPPQGSRLIRDIIFWLIDKIYVSIDFAE